MRTAPPRARGAPWRRGGNSERAHRSAHQLLHDGSRCWFSGSTASDRFPRFEEFEPKTLLNCRLRRVISPSSGSTLMTSAPWSARNIVASGPESRLSGRARERHGADQPSLPISLKWYCKDGAGNDFIVSLPAVRKMFSTGRNPMGLGVWAAAVSEKMHYVSAGAETRRRVVRIVKLRAGSTARGGSPPVVIRRGTSASPRSNRSFLASRPKGLRGAANFRRGGGVAAAIAAGRSAAARALSIARPRAESPREILREAAWRRRGHDRREARSSLPIRAGYAKGDIVLAPTGRRMPHGKGGPCASSTRCGRQSRPAWTARLYRLCGPQRVSASGRRGDCRRRRGERTGRSASSRVLSGAGSRYRRRS